MYKGRVGHRRSSTVTVRSLLPYHRRDGACTSGRYRDGNAGDNVQMDVELIAPIAMEDGLVRYPRRWRYRWRRCGQDHRVIRYPGCEQAVTLFCFKSFKVTASSSIGRARSQNRLLGFESPGLPISQAARVVGASSDGLKTNRFRPAALEAVKWLLVVGLVAAVIGNNISRSAYFYRVVGVVVVALMAVFVALQTERGKAFNQLRKDSWSSYARLSGRPVRNPADHPDRSGLCCARGLVAVRA